MPAYGSASAAPQDEFDMLSAQDQQQAAQQAQQPPDEFSTLAATDRQAQPQQPAPLPVLSTNVLATPQQQPAPTPAAQPAQKPAAKPAGQPRTISAPQAKKAASAPPHVPTPLEQVGANIAHLGQQAYAGAHQVPILGDAIRLGEEYVHNPAQAAAATAANIPAGIIGLPQDVVNLSNQLTRQQAAGQVADMGPADLTSPARKTIDYATQVANVLLHRKQLEPVQVKEAYQAPFQPVLEASPAAAGAGDLIGNLLGGKGMHLPGPPQIKALENNPIVQGLIHGAISGEGYGALGSLANQAEGRQHEQADGKDIRGLNLKQAVKEGSASIAPGILLGAAGGAFARKPAPKLAPGTIPPELLEFKKPGQGAPTPTTQAPAAQPGKARGSFSFAPGMKQQLEARDAQEATANPYGTVKKIDDWKNTLNDQLANAQSADDVLQAKNDAAAWISKNGADKSVKDVLKEHLDKTATQADLKIKADAQKAKIEAAQAKQAATPPEPAPAPVAPPPKPPEQPAPQMTPEQIAEHQRQDFIRQNFPNHNEDLSSHDFSTFKGTREEQYRVNHAEPFSPHHIYDEDIDPQLDILSQTREHLNKAYENADRNTRTRLTGIIKILDGQEKAIVHEKARRAYLTAQGVEPDWVKSEPVEGADTSAAPAENPSENQHIDFKQVPDDELVKRMIDPAAHGLTDDQHMAAIAEYEARHPEPAPEESQNNGQNPGQNAPSQEPETPPPAAKEPGQNNGQNEVAKSYKVDKQGPWYHVTDQDGNVLSKTKDRKQAERRVESLNSGAKHGQGKRTDKSPQPDDSTSYQRAAIDYGNKFDASNLPPEVSEPLQRLVEQRHRFDQARNKVLGIAQVAGKAKGLDLKLKGVRKFDPEVEKAVAAAAKNPEESGFSIEMNSGKKPAPEAYKPAKGENVLGALNNAIGEMKSAEADYNTARDTFKDQYLPRRGELPPSINVNHEGNTFNVRLTNKESRAATTNTPGEQALSDDVKHITKAIEKDPYLEQTVQAHNLGEVLDAVGKELGKQDNVLLEGSNPLGHMVSAAVKVKRGLDNAGVKLDPRMLHQVFMNQFNSDKYELTADPQFWDWYNRQRGALDLSLQGVEKLHTEDERDAWLKNRYADPDDIRAGLDGADKLSPAQREGLIKQNQVLDQMSDGFEQYAEHLRQQGYNGKGFFNTILPMNNLLATLESDLQQLDPRRYRGENWLQDLGSGVTRGIYDMYVTGNWSIHALHAIEAGTVGTAYHPQAFAKAVGDLASSYTIGDPGVKEFVESFDSSSGIQKRVKEENQTKLGKYWRGLQKGAFDTAGKLVGVDNATEKIAHNDKLQTGLDVLEGSIAEDAKLKLMRAMSAHIAADEMGYQGGGTQLMKDMADALHNPKAMDAESRIEAATKIVYHMNQMVGYSPSGFSDMNVLTRMASKTSPIFKWFTPFATTRLQQSRVITKFFTNSMKAASTGDVMKAGRFAGQGLLCLGLISMINGRGGIPLDIQQALHAADPDKAKEILEQADKFNVIGKLADTEVEHVTPQLFVPMFMGDSFPTQLLDAGQSAYSGKGWSQIRGIATLAATVGMSSIGGRMGLNQIIKVAKALETGKEGHKDVYAFRHGDTLRSGAKLGLKIADTAAKVGGLDLKVPRMDDMLGKRKVDTNTPRELFGAVTPGMRIENAEIINKMRDDQAFGDKLHNLDQKAYQRAKNSLFKIQKAAAQEKDWNAAREKLNGLDGYWERTLKQYLQNHEAKNGQEEGNTKAATHAEA